MNMSLIHILIGDYAITTDAGIILEAVGADLVISSGPVVSMNAVAEDNERKLGAPLIISYGTTYVLSYPYNHLALQKERGCLTDLIQWLMELLLISLSARSRLVRVPSNSPTVSVFSRSSSDDFTPESCRFQLSRPELNILTLFRFLVPSVFLCFRLFLLYFLCP